MNARMRKKEYKRILKAKAMFDRTMCADDLFKVIMEGYVNPPTRLTASGRAIRKVLGATTLIRTFDGWEVPLPKTSDALKYSGDYQITIYGRDYADADDEKYTDVIIDVKRLFSDGAYFQQLRDNDQAGFLADFICDLYQQLTTREKAA
ncbi:MAG: hypothetical protein NC311_06375 [Muribaculaceae bacterium]|nr:hypothetical protein [Muribaculaceae bacterium]